MLLHSPNHELIKTSEYLLKIALLYLSVYLPCSSRCYILKCFNKVHKAKKSYDLPSMGQIRSQLLFFFPTSFRVGVFLLSTGKTEQNQERTTTQDFAFYLVKLPCLLLASWG